MNCSVIEYKRCFIGSQWSGIFVSGWINEIVRIFSFIKLLFTHYVQYSVYIPPNTNASTKHRELEV